MGLWIDVLAWVGAVLILLAYGLVSAGRIRPRSRVYQLMNILRSAGLIVSSGWNGAWPSSALSVVLSAANSSGLGKVTDLLRAWSGRTAARGFRAEDVFVNLIEV